jgi:4-amino-4-deoxy-L-arabinose transferase-like glycosyltransferase
VKLPAWAQALVAFVLALDIAAAWQWLDGAYASELGGHEDEATHYLSAVSLRDAVPCGRTDQVLAPGSGALFFDVKLALWMACFGNGRVAALLFMAVLAAANATVIFAMVRRESGLWPAVVAAIVWLCAPLVRASAEMVLPDQMQALLLTIAIFAWTRLATAPGWPVAVFCALAGTAALFSGVSVWALGIALAAVPLLLRKACVLRLPQALAALVVMAVPGVLRLHQPLWPARLPDFAAAGRELPGLLGSAVIAFALAALVLGCRKVPSGNSTWPPCLAVIIGVTVSAAVFGHGSMDRELLAASPVLAILAAGGAVAVSWATTPAAQDERRRQWRAALWVSLLLLLALPTAFTSGWHKDWSGFGPVAEELLAQCPAGSHVLVVSDRRGEGMLLAEVAMRDRGRRLIVERGADFLTDGRPAARNGRSSPRFFDDETLMAHLTAGRIRYVVIDTSVPYEGHADYQDQMRRILEDHPRQYWPAFDSAITRGGETQGHPLRVYRVITGEAAGEPPSK